MGAELMAARNVALLFCLFLVSVSFPVYAEDCNAQSCKGFITPPLVKTLLNDGYEKIEIKKIFDLEYLFVTTSHDVNQCSIIFKIVHGKIEDTPSAGVDGKLCNISLHDKYVVSSWRDKGEWNDDVYMIIQDKWTLLFRDACVGCQQVKRIYKKDGKNNHTVLLSDGSDFLSREPLNGIVEESKAHLYSGPKESEVLKAYLIRGDEFILSDMSDDGMFYKIIYKTPSGGKNYWIKSDSFSLK
ncbi:hypothetical protein [Aeromonas caviae]|uniref:hypothetical protein n=1 Tax=Aeromonas caviae TaxID=648 RepID=UPI00313DB36B